MRVNETFIGSAALTQPIDKIFILFFLDVIEVAVRILVTLAGRDKYFEEVKNFENSHEYDPLINQLIIN